MMQTDPVSRIVVAALALIIAGLAVAEEAIEEIVVVGAEDDQDEDPFTHVAGNLVLDPFDDAGPVDEAAPVSMVFVSSRSWASPHDPDFDAFVTACCQKELSKHEGPLLSVVVGVQIVLLSLGHQPGREGARGTELVETGAEPAFGQEEQGLVAFGDAGHLLVKEAEGTVLTAHRAGQDIA